MKYLIPIIVIISSFNLFSQSTVLQYREYLDANNQGLHQFGDAAAFSECHISEDYGPRTPHNKQFHGGVDFNVGGVFTGNSDIRNMLLSADPGVATVLLAWINILPNMGKQVLERPLGSQENSIQWNDLNFLSNGIYFIQLKNMNGKTIVSKKLVKL